MQGDRQAAAVRLGDEMDGGGCGGGAEPAGVELHTGAMESVLVEGGSLGIPCRRLSEDQSGFTSNLGRTRARYSMIAFSSAATLRNPPRRIRCSVIAAKKRSTWLSHEPLVGVKCRRYSGCRSNHRFTAAVLCVP